MNCPLSYTPDELDIKIPGYEYFILRNKYQFNDALINQLTEDITNNVNIILGIDFFYGNPYPVIEDETVGLSFENKAKDQFIAFIQDKYGLLYKEAHVKINIKDLNSINKLFTINYRTDGSNRELFVQGIYGIEEPIDLESIELGKRIDFMLEFILWKISDKKMKQITKYK